MTGRSFIVMGLFHTLAGIILAVVEPADPMLYASQFFGGLFEVAIGLMFNHWNHEVTA